MIRAKELPPADAGGSSFAKSPSGARNDRGAENGGREQSSLRSE